MRAQISGQTLSTTHEKNHSRPAKLYKKTTSPCGWRVGGGTCVFVSFLGPFRLIRLLYSSCAPFLLRFVSRYSFCRFDFNQRVGLSLSLRPPLKITTFAWQMLVLSQFDSPVYHRISTSLGNLFFVFWGGVTSSFFSLLLFGLVNYRRCNFRSPLYFCLIFYTF